MLPLYSPDVYPTEWECVPCPDGASCDALTPWFGVNALFGYYRVPILSNNLTESENPANFERCLFAGACLGARNTDFAKQFFKTTDATHDYALYNMDMKNDTIFEECNEDYGFNTTSRLCHTCAFNHRRMGRHRCSRCPASAELNWVLMLLGAIITIVLLSILVKLQIEASGKTNVSALIQKSIINYFQVAALFASFPLEWPKSIRDFFEIQGAVSTVGDYLLNPDCAAPYSTAAKLFYDKQIGYLMLPPCLVVIIYIFWKLFARFKKQQWHRTEEEKDMITERSKLYVKDQFVTTVCFLIYLLFPTAVKQAFGVFNCYTIGGKPYLLADLEEECYSGRHLIYVILVGIPQVIFYVFGLPILGLYFLKRNKTRLSQFAPRARYSLL